MKRVVPFGDPLGAGVRAQFEDALGVDPADFLSNHVPSPEPVSAPDSPQEGAVSPVGHEMLSAPTVLDSLVAAGATVKAPQADTATAEGHSTAMYDGEDDSDEDEWENDDDLGYVLLSISEEQLLELEEVRVALIAVTDTLCLASYSPKTNNLSFSLTHSLVSPDRQRVSFRLRVSGRGRGRGGRRR